MANNIHKLDHNIVSQRFADCGHELLSVFDGDWRKQLQYLCRCGNVSSVSYDNFKQRLKLKKDVCPKCRNSSTKSWGYWKDWDNFKNAIIDRFPAMIADGIFP